MKISKRVSDTVTIHAEAEKMTDLFEELAQLEEVFSIDMCAKCQQKGLKHVHRVVEDNNFYEVQCKNSKCKAKLQFGCHKKGNTIFPKWEQGFRTMAEILKDKENKDE